MIIHPARSLRGIIALPGDKSISHRAALLGALAEGQTKIENFASSLDCQSTLDCLQHLGVTITRSGATVVIDGVGSAGFHASPRPLDAGNSGSTIRMLAGVLAGQPFTTEITGDESLRRRPMQRIIAPLAEMGATIEAQDGRAPLRITGGALKPITYRLPVASAQVKSCVLLAGLFADGYTTVIEATPTRNHTELMLAAFGAELTSQPTGQAQQITVHGPARLTAQEMQVPSDLSSAAFFIAAALMVPDSDLTIKAVGLNPTRAGLLELLTGLGAEIERLDQRTISGELIGDLRIRPGRLKSPAGLVQVNGALIANLIDEIPMLAVLATQSDADFVIADAAELRHKESDRIKTVATGLTAMGAQVEERPDGLIIPGRQKLRGAAIDSHGDHRIAMAFAVAGLAAEGPTEILGAEAAAVSFPEFFQTLATVTTQA